MVGLLFKRVLKFNDTVVVMARTAVHFKSQLEEFCITLERIKSKADEITKRIEELDLRERDSNIFTAIIKEAEDVIYKCLKIKWNDLKRYSNSLLKNVNEKLLKVFQLEAQVDQSTQAKEMLVEMMVVKLRMDGLLSNMEYLRETRREQTTFEIQASSEDFYKEFETSSSSSQWSQPCRQFEFREILLATNDFDESLVIGHGGFGKVYKGIVINGSSLVIVEIKRLDSTSCQGAAEFWAEVEILSRLRHCNLVSLIGYCNYGREMILIYEYMSNGTLADHLHMHGTPLSWIQRLKICIGAGRGLHYLHTGTGIEVGVTHRDVKTSNILLHENWAAKISDFGLSKIGPMDQPSTYVKTQVRGTFGYLDPDYYYTGKLTRKTDVYAFGVEFLEVLCGSPALDRSLDDEKQNLARWAQESIKEGNLKRIIDSDLRDQISPKCLKEFVLIAKRCLHNNPKKRPAMADVVGSLESVLSLQQKWNNSLETAEKTILGRMRCMFTLPSMEENSGISNSF